jgi:hypothetical protein
LKECVVNIRKGFEIGEIIQNGLWCFCGICQSISRLMGKQFMLVQLYSAQINVAINNSSCFFKQYLDYMLQLQEFEALQISKQDLVQLERIFEK